MSRQRSAPRPDGPRYGPEAVGSVSSCFYLGGKVWYRVHVILELLSTSLPCRLLGVDLLKDNDAKDTAAGRGTERSGYCVPSDNGAIFVPE